jgi:hypothetical protein
MSKNFSQQLVEDFKMYWFKRFKEHISDDQAEQYLVALSDLYIGFSNIQKDKGFV